MSWYRTGLADLVSGSTAVQGFGTQWSRSIKPGEGFLAPDGRTYEVAEVLTDTSLNLVTPYLGTTEQGAIYAILPTQGYVKVLSVQVAELVALYSQVPAEAAAAATSASQAAASATAADTSATTAATKATEAAGSAQDALDRATLAGAHKDAAAASATASETSSTNSANSATAASSSATAAAGSASTASTKATEAAASAAAAADDAAYVSGALATKADAAALTAHTGDTANPHGVTKTQVGLGNVDDTADTDKPISTAQQTALDLKVPRDSATGAATLPVGTQAQRPAGAAGKIRFNSDIGKFEGHNGTSWASVGGGATGGGSDAVFVENDKTVTANYTLPTGKNAHSVGPITVNDGVTVTVSDGCRWVVS